MNLEPDFVIEIVHFNAHVAEIIKQKMQLGRKTKTDSLTESLTSSMTSIYILALMRNPSSTQCFPNVAIALRIYFSIRCSVAEDERSISKLSRIKNDKRSTIGQERLNALSLLSIEHELAREVNFSQVIEQFAQNKARKVII